MIPNFVPHFLLALSRLVPGLFRVSADRLFLDVFGAALLSQFNSTTLGAAPSALWDDVVSCADPLLQQRRLAAHGKQLREATAAFRQGTVN